MAERAGLLRTPAPVSGPGRRRHHALPLPELDGARIALGGLHSVDGQSYLHVFGCGLPPAWTSRRFGPEARPAFGWWLRDDAGHWHAAVPWEWTEDVRGEMAIMLRVLPPLGQETKLRHALHHPPGQPGQCPCATVLVGVAMTGLPGESPGPAASAASAAGPWWRALPAVETWIPCGTACTRSAGKMAASACPPIPTSKANSSSRRWAARKRPAWTWPKRGGGTPTTSAVLALGPRGPGDDVDVTWDDVEEFRSGSPNAYRWPSSGTRAARVVPHSQPMRPARRQTASPAQRRAVPGRSEPGDRHVCRPVWATRSRPPGARNWNGPGRSGWTSCCLFALGRRSSCCCPGWSRPAGPTAAPAPPGGGSSAPPWRPR